MKVPRATFPSLARFITLLLVLVSCGRADPARCAEEAAVSGILVYKSQPWHKAGEALVKEYASVRRFATVLYVAEPGKKERRLRQALVFEAHDYLPFDTKDTAKDPLSTRIDREIAALENLAKRFPIAKRYVEPRIGRWRTIQAQNPAATAPPPSSPQPLSLTPGEYSAASEGNFRNTELPPGGALGTIHLVSGEEFQAWITHLTPTHLKWDEPIKEGSGVYRERIVPLAEVQSLKVYTAEDVARSQLQKLKVPQTSLTTLAYNVLYGHYFRLLEKMRAQFGSDPRYAEWHSELVQIREDMEQAQSTLILRIDGRWLTREEMRLDAYENAAKVLWASARQMAELSQWKLAIEYCRELQRTYPGSRTFVESVPAMTKWLESFGKDRPSFHALSENPDAAEQVAAILENLGTIDLEAARKSLALSARASEAIYLRNRDEAERLIRESAQAWSFNAEVRVLRQRLQSLPAKK